MSSGLRGQRVVVGLYLIIVAFTGFAGYMTASVVDQINPPRFLFLIEFPPTPLGLAAFGALTIGLLLGILLLAVTAVSTRFDDADPGSEESTESTDSAAQPTSSTPQSTDSVEQSTESTESTKSTKD
ncbi:hypothetical protein halTADL_1028 [Halohasta litchfieldiae]|uniref:Lipopolysaccharide assembly protein A domain-containing protein n=1 Tax=Halohasta litchfieldiae TaxID=1073996 RepID=A0A1H6XUE9_9EURY|nr:hypothetical protein [Halohasta litchfieldiae]ATW87822.1 hypothetical protein halTADL_1028 [Halohasta litchfieldiae]SEJ32661.1 hypothetical protein SAMN05444271_1483 [Halohasta litchfieldiae]